MSILSFLIFGLIFITKINGEVAKDYTGKCNDIYVYLEKQGKTRNLHLCNVNDKGEVTELILRPHCLNNEEMKTILSGNTIETLTFTAEYNYMDNKGIYSCTSLPINYDVISTLTNLKELHLIGIENTDINIIRNIPKSVEILIIGGDQSNYFKLTQKNVNAISKLTNLKSLTFQCTEIADNVNYRKFKNLKKLTYLNLDMPFTYGQGRLLKYCNYLKELVIYFSVYNEKLLDTLGYLTTLERLSFEGTEFEDDASFSSLEKLTNLTSLEFHCYISGHKNTISPNLFALTKLKKFILRDCGTTIAAPLNNSLTWANLKNLEYLTIVDYQWYEDSYDYPNRVFNLTYLGDLPSLKEVHVEYTGYSSLPESIGNLKNLTKLYVANNSIKTLPKSIGNLEKLEELNLFSNELIALPDEIGNLKNLVKFDASRNEISSLPKSIGNLEKLEKLKLNFNNLTSLPDEIGNLKNLVEFDVSDNKISSLPESIENLENLKIKRY